MAGAKLAGVRGWLPAGKDLREAKLAGADLSGCYLSGVDLSSADLTNTNLKNTNLIGAKLAGARGGRAGARVAVTGLDGRAYLQNTLKVGQPVVFALTAARALRLAQVRVHNYYSDSNTAKRMAVLTGPAAAGPWTPVFEFTSAQTDSEQTFAAPADAPALAGFVQVVVHDTYGGNACVHSIVLEGAAFGPAA